MLGLFCYKMAKKAVVAMSGGVDSSVAAALLKKQGYEVIGVTMCFNLAEKEGDKPSCCGLAGIEDARRVCHKLGIRHYVLNLDKEFSRQVIKNFYEEYLRGRTPNPCVRCNQFIKFDVLLKKSLNLGADYLATGHYARITKKGSHYLLNKAKDLKKDQSYFLYRLKQGQLKKLIFPLSGLTKSQVRQIASDLGLNVADKKDSQEVCFLPDGKYRELVRLKGIKKIKPGKLVDKEGNILGVHQGITNYTIGQRHGLGISREYPLHVIGINSKNNQVIVGSRQQAFAKEFIVKNNNFISKPFQKKVEIKVRIRYNHKEMPAFFMPEKKGKARIIFKKPQFAITPGQSAVFYDRNTILGGGIIEKVVG